MADRAFHAKHGLTVNNNLLIANVSTGRVGINTASAVVALDINSSDAIALPTGGTGSRPATTDGYFRYNTDLNVFEGVKSGAWSEFITNPTTAIGVIFDGNGSDVPAGSQADLQIPFDCTIVSWTMLAESTGSCDVDIWVDSYANYPPTNTDSITGGDEPDINSSNKATDSTLPAWTLGINAGDTMRFNVDFCSSISRFTIQLEVLKA